MKKQTNDHSRYSSKISRINIELFNYKFFHSPSLIEHDDKRFIGRRILIDRFKNILTSNEPKSGAYLVTGYRGMGKSSFVNKVLGEISVKDQEIILKPFVVVCLLFLFYLLVGHLFILVAALLMYRILFRYDFFRVLNYVNAFKFYKRKHENETYLQLLKSIIAKKLPPVNFKYLKNKITEFVNKQRRVIIRLNLGHEVLNEKDILSLIAKNIEKEFKKYTYNFRTQFFLYLFKFLVLYSIAGFIAESEPIPNSFYQEYLPTQSEKYLTSLNKIELETNKNSDTLKSFTRNCIKEIRDSTKKTDNASFDIKLITIPATQFIKIADVYINNWYWYLSSKITSQKKWTHLNYLFLLSFFLLNFLLTKLSRTILRSSYVPFTSRKVILEKLSTLNEHIDSSVKTENNTGVIIKENRFTFNLNKKREREYPLASVRQIEKQLIDVFDEIDKLIIPILRPEFIIVFDELDKIDPHLNKNIGDKEEEQTDFDNSTDGFSGGAITRMRKKNVLKLLANLKFFVTTAKAKFIFISGRELYDAFLADVSDREFSISSIFHEVIYVESFLSDANDSRKSDIISMSEHYVCQFLMPEWYIIYKRFENKDHYETFTMKSYEEYLVKVLELKKDSDKLKKTMMLLYQFIHYLTHVSNGAPKKITNFFERYVVSVNSSILVSGVFIGNKRNNNYLSFGYMDQCRIGFIHYLANPIIMAIVNNVSSYGDKLLVSASFLIDHIYKFHGNGFSWRNLEHAPEILDINRTPELRNFISTIIGYLTQTHISPIVSGLYVFKFPKKISEEISFISKMSEEASAIFNFTLDESLSVKRHYSKLLKHYTQQYNSEKQRNNKNGDFIHATADIHHVLGDLHLFDEEYTDAIFEYQNCIQYITRDFKEIEDSHQLTHLLFIVRTMLKLGLTFEKRKTFNSAYLAYSELVSMAIDFRYIDETKLGLKYKVEKDNDWMGFKAVLYKPHRFQLPASDNIFIREMQPEKFNGNDKENSQFTAHCDELIPRLAKITTPYKNKLITRLSLFEDIRLMYQASLAKLFVLEKNQLGGISQANLDVVEGEFRNLHLATNLKDKFLISADFFKKLGDIMFYKNGLIDKESSRFFYGLFFWGYDIENDIEWSDSRQLDKASLSLLKRIPFPKFRYSSDNTPEGFRNHINLLAMNSIDEKYYLKTLDKKEDAGLIQRIDIAQNSLIGFFKKNHCSIPGMGNEILNKVYNCNNRREILLNNRNIPPCYACKYYNRSLKILADNLLKQEKNDLAESKAFIFLKALNEPDKFYSNRTNFSQILASTLGGFGDVLVSCSAIHSQSENKVSVKNVLFDPIRTEFLGPFFEYVKSSKIDKNRKFQVFNNLLKKIENISHLEKAILYYFASAKYHKRSSNLKEAHIMYKKILLLFIQYVTIYPEGAKKIKDYIDDIKKHIVKRIVQCIYSAYDHIHAAEIQKLKWINTYEMYEVIDLNQLSLFPEIEETLYAYYELKIKCNKYVLNEKNVTQLEKTSIEKLYDLQCISKFRLNNSIYNRLISLRFKALLNRELLERLLTWKTASGQREGYFFKDCVYEPQHPIEFYKSLKISLFQNIGSENFLITYFTPDDKTNLVCTFLDTLEHLVIDSIFCLQKFIEVVYQHNQTTLFTNSYVAEIYKQLFEWTQLFDFLFMLYAYMDNGYPLERNKPEDITKKKNKIKNKLAGHVWQRYEYKSEYYSDVLRQNSKDYLKSAFSFEATEMMEFDLNNMHASLKHVQLCSFKNHDDLFKNRTKKLYFDLCNSVDQSNMHVVDCNYLAEVGIKKYQNAFAMHKEGKPYKRMVEDMYYLNDDLDNDTFKFQLALERLQINSGYVLKNMKNLKSVYGNSRLFEIDKYLTREFV